MYSAADGPGGPRAAPWIVWGDYAWRRGWSYWGTSYGVGGLCTAPRMVRGDQVRHRIWSPRTMYGAVDGPGGPILGGTNYRMTVPNTSVRSYPPSRVTPNYLISCAIVFLCVSCAQWLITSSYTERWYIARVDRRTYNMALDISSVSAGGSSSTSLFQDYDPSSTAEEVSDSGDEPYNVCFLCQGEIVERSRSREGDAAVFCEGKHQQWAHARCAGIDAKQYEAMGSSDERWLCHLCKDPRPQLLPIRLYQASTMEAIQFHLQHRRPQL